MVKNIKNKNYINVMKINIFFLLMIFSLSFISADGDIGYVKQNDCIDLYNYCPTCSYINLTAIQYPNQTLSLMNLAMVKTDKNYVYEFCNTNKTGGYSYTTCGDKAGVLTCEDMTFEATTTGKTTPSGVPTFLGVLIIIIFGTACFMMFLSGTMHEVAFKIFFLVVALIFLMATLITGYMVLTDSNVTAAISTTTLSLVVVMGMILFIIFVWILIRQTINALDLYNIKHGKTWNVGSGSSVGGYNTKRAY